MRLILKIKETPDIKFFPPDIEVFVRYNEPLQDALDNLNQYRSPDNQIAKLFNEYGQEIPLTYKVKGDNTFYYTINMV